MATINELEFADLKLARFEATLRNVIPKLYEYAERRFGSWKLLKNNHEDLVNEIFARPSHLKRMRKLETEKEIVSYLKLAVDFMAREKFKRLKNRREESVEIEVVAPNDNEFANDVNKLYMALSLLDEAKEQDERTIFALRFKTGATHQEIGECLNIPKDEVYKKLKKACEKLRMLISKVDLGGTQETQRFVLDSRQSDEPVDWFSNPNYETRFLNISNINQAKLLLKDLPQKQYTLVLDCRFGEVNLDYQLLHDEVCSNLPKSRSVLVCAQTIPDDKRKLFDHFIACETSKKRKDILRQIQIEITVSVDSLPRGETRVPLWSKFCWRRTKTRNWWPAQLSYARNLQFTPCWNA